MKIHQVLLRLHLVYRPFLHNFFNLLNRLSDLHSHAIRRLSPSARRDLLWWMTLLPQWSGIRLIISTHPQIIIHTDTSRVKGIGGWWDYEPSCHQM